MQHPRSIYFGARVQQSICSGEKSVKFCRFLDIFRSQWNANTVSTFHLRLRLYRLKVPHPGSSQLVPVLFVLRWFVFQQGQQSYLCLGTLEDDSIPDSWAFETCSVDNWSVGGIRISLRSPFEGWKNMGVQICFQLSFQSLRFARLFSANDHEIWKGRVMLKNLPCLRRAFVAHGPPVVCLRTYVNGSWPSPCWDSKKCVFLLVWWVGVLSCMCLHQKRKRLTPRQWHEMALHHEVSGMAIHLWDSGAQKRKHLVGCPTPQNV